VKIYKVEAIILKRRNIGEADRILTVFSKQYGKLKIVARGIRKITSRRAPHLEIFSRVELMLHRGKTFDIVTEVEPIDGYLSLRKDLSLVSAAYYACELIDILLPERQEHRDVFELLKTHLSVVGPSDQFALSLLHMLGFLPPSKTLESPELENFIERIAERRMRTYHFLKDF